MNLPQSVKGRVAAAALVACGLAAPFEGLRNYAYLDPVNIPTICYGSTLGVQRGQYKSTAECNALLGVEMTQRVMTVERCVPGLPIHMLAAWSSAIYNTGDHLVCDPKRSTAARLLLNGELIAACHQLLKWDKATVQGHLVTLPGLTRRRAAEESLCLT